jgi:hypothetical protein
MMTKKWLGVTLLTLLLLGGLGFAGARAMANTPSDSGAYVCPITDVELPFASCCPLN